MGKIIDVKGLLGGKYNERNKQRKIDELWRDLESMSDEDFAEKHNVKCAGPMINEITDDNEEFTLEEDFESEEFSQLTDEDLF